MEKNPNETILVPLLNKRVSELYSANILLEAKLLWSDEEKAELLRKIDAVNEQLFALKSLDNDRETELNNKIDQAKNSVRQAAEQEKSELVRDFERQKQELLQSFDNRVQVAVNDVKRAAGLDISTANAYREEAEKKNSILLENIAAIQKEVARLESVNASLKKKVFDLENPVKEPSKAKTVSKKSKTTTIMGGDTY